MTNEHKQIAIAMSQLREAYILLNELLPHNGKQERLQGAGEDYTSKRILKVVTDVFGIDPLIKGRKQNVVYSRHAYRYLLRKHTLRSMQSIAALTSCEDHTVVIRSIHAVNDLLATDKNFAYLITKCEELI